MRKRLRYLMAIIALPMILSACIVEPWPGDYRHHHDDYGYRDRHHDGYGGWRNRR